MLLSTQEAGLLLILHISNNYMFARSTDGNGGIRCLLFSLQLPSLRCVPPLLPLFLLVLLYVITLGRMFNTTRAGPDDLEETARRVVLCVLFVHVGV